MPLRCVSPPVRWHGLILAGGAARRFGRDKVVARVNGQRLIDLATASLVDADGVSVALGTPERAASLAPLLPSGVTGFADDRPGCGPMGGLASALARHRDSWVAALAADLPLVPAAGWSWLAHQHRQGAVARVPRDARGRWEPLAALYHGSLVDELRSHVASGQPARLALHTWLDTLAAKRRVVSADPASMPGSALLNVNRPEDAARLEGLLQERLGSG